jgi:hypothetical protein
MVSAWPEPPSAMSADSPAEPTAGAINAPPNLASDPSHVGRPVPLSRSAAL